MHCLIPSHFSRGKSSFLSHPGFLLPPRTAQRSYPRSWIPNLAKQSPTRAACLNTYIILHFFEISLATLFESGGVSTSSVHNAFAPRRRDPLFVSNASTPEHNLTSGTDATGGLRYPFFHHRRLLELVLADFGLVTSPTHLLTLAARNVRRGHLCGCISRVIALVFSFQLNRRCSYLFDGLAEQSHLILSGELINGQEALET